MMKICPQCFDKYGDEVVQCAKEATPLLALGDHVEAPLIGTLAGGRYLLLDVVGSGGMGVVYVGYQLAMARHVAVKVLTGKGAPASALQERFVREAKCAAQLRSPHTITVHDFGTLENGDLFLVMELLSGPTLEEVIWRDRKLPPERVLRIVEQICVSLEEAHAMGMIHRDIKPKNIIIEDEGPETDRAKLLDFGLVMLTEPIDGDAARLTRPGVIHGSPAYMAPEMWADQFGAITPATDIYALGCVMVEMLTGALLFHAGTIPQFMCKHVFDPVPPLAGAESDPLIAAMEKIIRRCLEKKPEDRYASVRALRLELAALRTASAPALPAAAPRAPSLPPVARAPSLPPTPAPPPPAPAKPEEWGFASTIPSATTDPKAAAAHAPKRQPIVLLASACVVVFLAVLMMLLREPEKNDSRPLAFDAPKTATVAAKPAAPVEPAPPVAKAPPPKKAAPPKPRGLRITGVKLVAGLIDPDQARSVLDALDLKSCMKRELSTKLTMRIIVKPNGSAQTVRVTPASDEGAALEKCATAALAARSFPAFSGYFETVEVSVE